MTIGEALSIFVCIIFFFKTGVSLLVPSRRQRELTKLYMGSALENAVKWVKRTGYISIFLAVVILLMLILCYLTEIEMFSYMCIALSFFGAILLLIIRFAKLFW